MSSQLISAAEAAGYSDEALAAEAEAELAVAESEQPLNAPAAMAPSAPMAEA